MRKNFITIVLLLVSTTAPAALSASRPSPSDVNHASVDGGRIPVCTRGKINLPCGKLSRLMMYVGTYDFDAVLHDPRVHAALVAVTGTVAFELGGDPPSVIHDSMTRKSPIAFIDGYLVLNGRAGSDEFMGDGGSASVWLRVYDGKAYATVHKGTQTWLFADEPVYNYLPFFMRVAMTNEFGALQNSCCNTLPGAVTSWVRSSAPSPK